MLRLGNAIRLTSRERAQLEKIGGGPAGRIHTLEDFRAVADAAMQQFDVLTPEGALLQSLLADFITQTLGADVDKRHE